MNAKPDKWPFMLHFWLELQGCDSNHLRLLVSTPLFMKLPYKEATVNGIKGFFEIDKGDTITQAITNVD